LPAHGVHDAVGVAGLRVPPLHGPTSIVLGSRPCSTSVPCPARRCRRRSGCSCSQTACRHCRSWRSPCRTGPCRTHAVDARHRDSGRCSCWRIEPQWFVA
jgi:hypothetical protein